MEYQEYGFKGACRVPIFFPSFYSNIFKLHAYVPIFVTGEVSGDGKCFHCLIFNVVPQRRAKGEYGFPARVYLFSLPVIMVNQFRAYESLIDTIFARRSL
jgi:hypothetical protein